jgi:zinc protease
MKNGLTILLAERHAAPVVTVMMLYRVGSRNEAVGYTGATHFLEHMMFKGSSKYDPLKKTGVDDILKPVGGINNATTWFDRTSYFEVLPAKNLELALSLEADRMRHLFIRETDRKSEMTVVRNELERSENEPGSVLQTQLFATAFQQHPYHHPTIGWRTDVEGVPIERLRQFYNDFYWPNNATLLIIGDLNPTSALQLVAKNFGAIPSSPKPIPKVYTAEPPQQGERRFIVQRGEDLPKLNIAFHIPRATDKDAPALSVLEYILGDNSRPSSRLYKRLIDPGIASDTYAYAYELRDPGIFMVSATMTAGAKPEAAEAAVNSELEALKKDPVSAEELNRAKTSIVKKLKLSVVDPLNLAEQLGEAIAVADWKWWASYSDRISAVTAADITRVVNKYFTVNNRTVGTYLPKVAPVSKPAANQISLRHGIAYRTEVSPPAPRATFASRVTRKVLPNGLTLLVMPIAGSGTVSLNGKIRAGGYFAPTEKSLMPNFSANMLTKGSSKFTKEALAQQLDSLGTSLDFSSGDFWSSFSSDIVTEDLPTLLNLLAEVVQHPTYPADELARTRKIVEAELKQHMVDTREVSDNLLDNALYKPGNPYFSKTFTEQINELPQLTPADLAGFHQKQYVPGNMVLSIVGDIEPEKAIAAVESTLGLWPKGVSSKIAPPPVSAVSESKVIKTPIADKENVDTTIGRPVDVNIKHPDFYAAMIANSALGHSPFSTRLAPVREKYGYTYDVSSTFQNTAYGGAPWVITYSTNPENTVKATDLIKKIVADYVAKGISKSELDLEAKHLAGEYVVAMRSPSDIAERLSRYEMVGVSPKYMDEFAQNLARVTKPQADAAIRKYFTLDKSVTSIAGPIR